MAETAERQGHQPVGVSGGHGRDLALLRLCAHRGPRTRPPGLPTRCPPPPQRPTFRELTDADASSTAMLDIGCPARQGYATEAAAAVRHVARDAGVEHLIAIIRPDNLASRRVALKIGLVLEREVEKNGGPALIFGGDLP